PRRGASRAVAGQAACLFAAQVKRWLGSLLQPRGEAGARMTAVRRWTGRETTALRTALRRSLRDFAEHLGVSARTVSKWEAGGVNVCPRPEMQAALDTALSRGGADVRARFALLLQEHDTGDHGTPTRPGGPLAEVSESGAFSGVVAEVERDDMSPLTRRLLMIHSLVAGAGPRVSMEELSWVAAALGRAASPHYTDSPGLGRPASAWAAPVYEAVLDPLAAIACATPMETNGRPDDIGRLRQLVVTATKASLSADHRELARALPALIGQAE